MTEPRLKLSPPWVLFAKKLEALFDPDPEIAFNVDYESKEPKVVMATNNPEKAAALIKILPEEVDFGNVKLPVVVDCDKVVDLAFKNDKELFETAFAKNPVFAYAVTPGGTWFVPYCYVVFKKEVSQFFGDNLLDPHGVISMLYQDIASEIFSSDSYTHTGFIAYATDIESKILGMPTNWP